VGGSPGAQRPQVPRQDRARNPPKGKGKAQVTPYFFPFLLLFLPFFFAGIVLALLRGEETEKEMHSSHLDVWSGLPLDGRPHLVPSSLPEGRGSDPEGGRVMGARDESHGVEAASVVRPTPGWAVVSGATGGIGREVVLELARSGWSLALIARSRERLAEVQCALSSVSTVGEIESFCADLSSIQATDSVAASITDSLDRIDVLVNNAGGIFSPFQRTVEGVERTWALNVLSPFLLTERLLPCLVRSGRGRVVNISSAAHGTGRLRWEDLQRESSYSAWGAYSQSKLALLMLTYEWSRRHQGIPVTFNAAHPGFVRTSFGQSLSGPLRWLVRFAMIGAVSPRRGARTPVWMAQAPELASVSGQYFADQRPRRSAARSHRAEEARRLYEECAREVAQILFGNETVRARATAAASESGS